MRYLVIEEQEITSRGLFKWEITRLRHLICAFSRTDYYLGDNQNAVEDLKGMDPKNPNIKQKKEKPKGVRAKLEYFFS